MHFEGDRMMSLAVFSMWPLRACGNELHPAGQTLDTYGLLISGRKWKSCHMTKLLRPVRLWNQLSGNGQMGPGPMYFPKGGMSVSTLFTEWDVFVELRESHGHAERVRFGQTSTGKR